MVIIENKKYAMKLSKIIGLGLLMLAMILSCSPMDEYKDFFKNKSEIQYTGKLDSVLVYSGKERVMIRGLFLSDPKITECRIYWNSKLDSVSIPVERTEGVDTLEYIINLPENGYNFEIYTFDKQGNKSVPVYVTGISYGASYSASLTNRLIFSATLDDDQKVTVKWRDINKTLGAFATELIYTDNTNQEQHVVTNIKETTSILNDYKSGTPILYRTLYMPDTLSIDTFYSASQNYQNLMFSKRNWTIPEFSSNHGGDDNRVQNVIDGTATTRWHTLVGKQYPHFVVVDMQKKRNISSFSIESTTFEAPDGDSRAPTTFQLLVSDDRIEWKDLGIHNFNNLLNREQFYPIVPTVSARYFKFIGLTGTDNNMVVGEISVYGY